MYTENGLNIDLDGVRDILDTADVLTIGFPFLRERLLVDFRATDASGPFVSVVEPVGNVQERYHWLGRHRGEFGMPEAFSYFQWPHSTRVLNELDLLSPIRHRLAVAPNGDAALLDPALTELQRLEQLAAASAIVGSGPWKTIWQRPTDENAD